VPDGLADLDVGPIERPDGERAVEANFNVARSGGLGAGSRDLLGEIGSGIRISARDTR